MHVGIPLLLLLREEHPFLLMDRTFNPPLVGCPTGWEEVIPLLI
jgi:hypothetical protein